MSGTQDQIRSPFDKLRANGSLNDPWRGFFWLKDVA
jgi:hypothetical protein